MTSLQEKLPALSLFPIGETAGYQHIFLFPQWFRKFSFFRVVKKCGKGLKLQTIGMEISVVNPLPADKFRLVQIKRICRQQNKSTLTLFQTTNLRPFQT